MSENPQNAEYVASLTQEERRALRCDCVGLDRRWLHKRSCHVPAVERIIAARLAPVLTLADEWDAHPVAGLAGRSPWAAAIRAALRKPPERKSDA